jgi:hypothetical protein
MDEYISALNEYKKTNGQPLSEKSKNTYIRNMNNLITKHGMDWRIPHLHDTYFKNFSTSQQINYINAIINYLQVLNKPEKTITIYKNERDRLTEKKSTEPMNEKKQSNLAEWDEILKWRDAVISHNEKQDEINFNDLQVECLLRFYTLLAQRRNEYADIVFYDNTMPTPDEPNTLFYDTLSDRMILSLADYKTQDYYGIQKFNINNTKENNNFKTFLLKYIISNDKRKHMFHLPSQPDTPLSRLNLTKLLNRSSLHHINKKISTDRIRKAYNSKYKGIRQELLKDSNNNAHSINTMMTHYAL